MPSDQTLLFILFLAVFGMLLWGRVRYDLVAFSALTIGVVIGVVPQSNAFDGFGHPATIIIALVLIVSRALSNSGAVDYVAKWVTSGATSIFKHICIMSGVAALLSAVMNNVAALALLMPVDIKAAKKAKRSPSLSLMPISFASILGGMITLIGTPPNIIVAAFRQETLGESYSMLDFAPVGIACAVAGVLFVSLIGWRLLPKDRAQQNISEKLFEFGDYIVEVKVGENSSAIGQQVRHLDEQLEAHSATIVGLVRNHRRLPGLGRRIEILEGDILILEADAQTIDTLVGELKFAYVRKENEEKTLYSDDLILNEAVVPDGASIVGRSAISMQLLNRYSITLLGVSRQGKRIRSRVRSLLIKPGDILLLLGPQERLPDIVDRIGALPLANRKLEVLQRDKAGLATGIFVAAILAASLGLLYLPFALAIACILFVAFGIVPGRQIYQSIEWPVIILIGSMIPLGVALENSGGTTVLADALVSFSEDYGPVFVLTLFMITTMSLSDVLNNTATTIIAAPVAIKIAEQLSVNPDPFLMAVAVAASCAFLTPIGHKNNTLILGPGGYRFSDYWRMGLPLEILVLAVSIPTILVVWPL